MVLLVVFGLPAVVGVFLDDRLAFDSIVVLSCLIAARVVGRFQCRIAVSDERRLFVQTEIGYDGLVVLLVVLGLPAVATILFGQDRLVVDAMKCQPNHIAVCIVGHF